MRQQLTLDEYIFLILVQSYESLPYSSISTGNSQPCSSNDGGSIGTGDYVNDDDDSSDGLSSTSIYGDCGSGKSSIRRKSSKASKSSYLDGNDDRDKVNDHVSSDRESSKSLNGRGKTSSSNKTLSCKSSRSKSSYGGKKQVGRIERRDLSKKHV